MNLSDKVSIPTQVMARTVGDETVILDLASGTYYGLDPIGARIWQLMGEGRRSRKSARRCWMSMKSNVRNLRRMC